jgi:hypothetical protein
MRKILFLTFLFLFSMACMGIDENDCFFNGKVYKKGDILFSRIYMERKPRPVSCFGIKYGEARQWHDLLEGYPEPLPCPCGEKLRFSTCECPCNEIGNYKCDDSCPLYSETYICNGSTISAIR